MGQKLKEDKIGTLTHNSGDIVLAASRLTIGGQQYTTNTLTRTISSDVTLTANTLYMIYAVLSAGSVVLRISTNVNSVGPAGFNSWKLVGAFYSDSAAAAVGSFINIDGIPTSNWFSFSVTIKGAISNPSTGTVAYNTAYMRRVGDSMQMQWAFRQTSAGSAGSGYYYFDLPGGNSIDTNKIDNTNTAGYSGTIGSASLLVNATGFSGVSEIPGPVTRIYMIVGNDATTPTAWGSANGSLANATIEAALACTVPISGWSATPLKDL